MSDSYLNILREAFMKRKKTHNENGFTLVEILTAMAVIAILLALLIPALSAIEETATKVKQKAQFNGIEVAMEAFYTDTGDYPPSEWNTTLYGNYTASQRLAEALLGRDGFGFHPDSQWDESGEDAAGKALYMDHADYSTDYPTQAAIDSNMAIRNGPYLELETANAIKLENLYGSLGGDPVNTYILADVYKISKNIATGNLAGSPILYYRANLTKIHHHISKASAMPGMNQCIYNVYDSIGSTSGSGRGIARLTPLKGNATDHPLSPGSGGGSLFYKQTINPNFPGDSTYPASGTPPRPYRAESFILQSAGPDGLYGSEDDVFNFDEE